MQFYSTVEKISCHVLSHPDRLLHFKRFYTSIEPRIIDLSPSLREWLWEIHSSEPTKHERDQPIWWAASAYINVSEYQSWKEGNNHLLPSYTLPNDYAVSTTDDMRMFVET